MTKKQIEGKWKKIERSLIPYTDSPGDVIDCIRELYELYDPACMIWLGKLFDAEIGGFYYSNSARDGDEFFPDIESTGQAIGLLECTGAISGYEDIPEWMRSRIACFICSCEDPENGFFYNPQWSKELTDTKIPRRSRDSRWAVDLAEMCNFKVPYPTAFTRIQEDRSNSAPRYLQCEENFLAELATKNWRSEIYRSMSWLASQFDQIIDAGLGHVVLSHIESLRDPVSGLWGEGEVGDVEKLKALGGVIVFYSAMRKPLPDPEKIAEFVFAVFDNEYTNDISFICARWTVIEKLVNLLVDYGDKDDVRIARGIIQRIVDNIEHFVSVTISSLALFKKPDGSFSYGQSFSSRTSQSMVVARGGVKEGDVNATILASAIPARLIRLITLSYDIIPLFTSDDVAAFDKAARGE